MLFFPFHSKYYVCMRTVNCRIGSQEMLAVLGAMEWKVNCRIGSQETEGEGTLLIDNVNCRIGSQD